MKRPVCLMCGRRCLRISGHCYEIPKVSPVVVTTPVVYENAREQLEAYRKAQNA